jgi:hypothetical protein
LTILLLTITFDWSEVTAVVEGILPIFGECVDMDARRHQVRKISILDYRKFGLKPRRFTTAFLDL